jgi:ribose transport system permease protein
MNRVRSAIAGAPIYTILVASIVLIIVADPSFASPGSFLVFVVQPAAAAMILAAGEVVVLITGEFDVSIGSLVTVVVLAAAALLRGESSGLWWVLVLLAGIGLTVGLTNGILSTVLGVPSFIATLGMQLVLAGGIFLFTGGAPAGSLPSTFSFLGDGSFFGVPVLGTLPYAVIVLVPIGALLIWILHHTDFGHQVFAVGSNPRAAALSGVSVTRVKIGAFLVSGVCAVVGGILIGGFGGVSPTAGQGLEFQAIAAAVLGGAVLGGGKGSVLGAMAGALTLECLFTVITVYGLPDPLRYAVQGAALMAAAAYSARRLQLGGFSSHRRVSSAEKGVVGIEQEG